jgi:hypothetical protein
MRASMYAVGHAQPGKAASTLRGISAEDIRCAECRRCSVQCALGLDIQPRAVEMAELLSGARDSDGWAVSST